MLAMIALVTTITRRNVDVSFTNVKSSSLLRLIHSSLVYVFNLCHLSRFPSIYSGTLERFVNQYLQISVICITDKILLWKHCSNFFHLLFDNRVYTFLLSGIQSLFHPQWHFRVISIQVGQDTNKSFCFTLTALLTKVFAAVDNLYNSPEYKNIYYISSKKKPMLIARQQYGFICP